jgi:Uma2 family endonuclease
MAAASPLYPIRALARTEEQRVLIYGVSWATYVSFRDAIDSSGIRMTYLKGTLEIMSPSREHEVSKTQIARLLEMFCFVRRVPLYGYGSTTFRREEKERGLEADECYCRDRDKPIPELALEVVVSRGGVDKLDVYAGLGIREVWIYEAGIFRVVVLRDGQYEPAAASALFPEVELARLAHYAQEPDLNDAVWRFEAELRAKD